MGQAVAAEDIKTWYAREPDFGRTFGEVAAHPDLGPAVRTLASEMMARAERDRVLDGVFKDAGRYLAAMWAFMLDQAGGLTLARMKAIAAATGMISPGRARALLQFLEHIGYVQRRPAGRTSAYAATPVFLSAWRAHLIAALQAGAVLEPGVEMLLQAVDPAVVLSFGRFHAESLMAALGSGVQAMPFLEAFMHPYAGNQIVWTMLAVAEGDAFPPERAGPISLSAMSRRFGVSRIHINRLFRRAEAAGLVRLDREGVVHFQPAARAELHLLYVAQLTHILIAAGQTARGHGLVAAPIKNVRFEGGLA